MISVRNVVKRYGSKVALNKVSLEVNKGKIVSLIGPNGAGKTTLIRILLTLIKPDGGEVEILGKNPFKYKGVFREVGYVQEIPNYPPFLTAKQLLELSAKIKGINKDQVKRVLELVEMENSSNTPIIKYSKGMVQRIAIAEALLGDPSVLILDEPYMGVDPIFSLKFRDILTNLKKEGISILMTSHEMEEVKKLSDYIYMIYRGEIIFQGSVEDMVKKFLGIQVIVETSDVNEAKRLLQDINYVTNVYEEGENKLVIKMLEDRREELLKSMILNGIRVKGYYLDLDIEEAYKRALKSV
ncbi:antibiotic ABC transporter ATP-binding protein [Sulfolobus sp. A20]|uniref:ABC transporter ATP-binding protein n=1 Tax=Sulfolobaceae TaxID=118883 RepID=UPI000845F330|nr:MULTISPECIES: ABC transporter ATP-binding protein [unclassified Sulfolobus]TRM77871.1 ABC transporter ATP-binding protein [Sulfolobus sp. A20-N-F8]TRM98958.1 ABC transporter ATP-binding protein [Sulfolobus sp. F1]TRN02172.1 ABC transporter ATP-binding protein [Sulfolobus sp. E1]AOL16718.1 antibiotic ABC transporter ATP-binding protein [Sulfolobus sp. A20]TRM97942.1 ABC transporter ATP-binding protein [Sulfolobus sp. B1]